MILPTTARETRCWYNYHLVQPYYFAHHHFHRRKVLALREAGLKAWILALVPEAQFIAHQARYEEALSSGYIKILRIPAGKTSEQILQVFLLRQIFWGEGVDSCLAGRPISHHPHASMANCWATDPVSAGIRGGYADRIGL